MTEDDSEVFEIIDFTTASEWERFIARVEEIFHDWKLTGYKQSLPLTKGELSTATWEEKQENITFADFTFVLSGHFLKKETDEEKVREGSSEEEKEREDGKKQLDAERVPTTWQDLMSLENDFPSRAHCLTRWYGVRDFIILTPAPNMDDVMTESRANVVLSSVSIALNNTACYLPVFVQIHQRWRRFFCGTCECTGARTAFQMVHLKHIPSQYSHLTGLLDVFKAKVACPLNSPPPVSVAVRFTYMLQEWAHYSWPQQPPDLDSMSEGEVGVTEFGQLPFGACEDPVSELHLSVTWPSLSEEMIVDNSVYSDLDPQQAPHWCVRIHMTESPQCLLGDYLREFVKICKRQESTDQLLGSSLLEDDLEIDVSQAFDRLTEPMPYKISSIGRVVTKATSKLQIRPEDAPIPTKLLNEILLYLFPDAKSETSDTKNDASTPMQSETSSMTSSGFQLDDMFKQFKSSPPNSLTFRLAICMCIINYSRGLRAVAHLWQEFVLEMRYRLENNFLIPDLDPGSPNMGSSLLHQKLQMLNCCIERKKSRETLLEESIAAGEKALREYELAQSQQPGASEAGSEDEDEFFECDDSEKADAATESPTSPSSTVKDDSFSDAHTHQADGRLKQMDDLRLLYEDEALFVPVTQEPSPMTEDMLEEHAEVLAKLGTSSEGAHLRARMQSACLLSDMEAFKAANPGCCMGDFVRWYSPRDWIEAETLDEEGNVNVKGQLSQRMQIPGNMWVEVWQSAKPVPARRQRRLFDDTKEAEKVLHWLSSMKPANVALRLMPMLLHAAVSKVKGQEEINLPPIQQALNSTSSRAAKVLRAPRVDVRRYEELVQRVAQLEVSVTRAQSLTTKLMAEKQDVQIEYNQLQQFVAAALDQPEIAIIGAARAPLGVIIHRLFMASQKSAYLLPEEGAEEEGDKTSKPSSFPPPMGREYILRTVVPRPSPWSQPTPQRMYCVLMDDEFRLAAAFSSDTTFQ